MMRKLLPVVVALVIVSPATAVDLEADFSSYVDGQEQGDTISQGGLLPGDSGKWRINFTVDEEAEIYSHLENTADDDNSCEEPEADAEGGSCGPDGELNESLEFSGFVDDDQDLENDSGEQSFDVPLGVKRIPDGSTTFEGLPEGEYHQVVLVWKVPREAGSALMTDSAVYDLTIGANSTSSGGTQTSGGTSNVGGSDVVTLSTSLGGGDDIQERVSDEDSGDVFAPDVTFSVEKEGLSIDVQDTTGVDESEVSSREWSFGDGTTATGATASHTYGSGDSYEVELTLTSNDGETASGSRKVQVEEVRQTAEQEEQDTGTEEGSDDSPANPAFAEAAPGGSVAFGLLLLFLLMLLYRYRRTLFSAASSPAS